MTEEKKRRKKVCPMCGQKLWLRDFYRGKDGKVGSYCKPCTCKWKRLWYEKNRKKPDGVFMHPEFGRLMEHKGASLKIFWNSNMLSTLRRHFPTTRNEELAGMLGVSQRTVVRKARELGLEKNPDFLHSVWNENRMVARSVGRKLQAGWFQKGHSPWNKKERKENSETSN